MDDSCAVCAETLEWAAYGSCGHREVCSTCIVRLRFVLDDRRCCICKTESSTVFITKALGDYTSVITDFSVFPTGATEGQVGAYWYHEDTQAYFDDVDHYRMIRAMCRLSCSICDKSTEDQGSNGTRRWSKFRNIEQLKGHLYHNHKMFMCNLCLEGRKVFICEQKLYARSQLNQHINTGDSEVDGSESERGGFMGHPMCEFCRNPFYGDNELYMHMSTEHYTCHICQRQHPGQYEYYKNYDDLEIHFQQDHFLCENEACLAKKFVVFQSESDMKRHNAIEHGGHMSRSKRNAALQIPTSFRYRRSNEQDQRRGRRPGFHHHQSESQLYMAIQASLEAAIADTRVRDSLSGAQPAPEHREISQADSVTRHLESLAINQGSEPPSRSLTVHSQSSRSAPVLEESSFPPLFDRELLEPSRHVQAIGKSSRSADNLGEESFPPLPKAKRSNKSKAKHGLGVRGKNTLTARPHLCRKDSVSILDSALSRSTENHELGSSSSASSQTRPTSNRGHQPSTSAGSQPWIATNQVVPPSSSARPHVKPERENGLVTPISATSTWNLNSANKIKQSMSAPKLVEGGSTSNSTASRISAVTGNQVLPSSSQSIPNVENVQTANKSLVERIRAGLDMDKDKFAAFKSISAEYRQGLIDTGEYLFCVQQFGLSHLVLELAQLCPDALKQKELIDAYTTSLQRKDPRENGRTSAFRTKGINPSIKGKGISVEQADTSSARDALTFSILNTVRNLQANIKPQEEEVEVLSKDGYRAAKGKLQLSAGEAHDKSSGNVQLASSSGPTESLANSTNSNNLGGGGSSKPRRKMSKFDRVRLGDSSAAALLDLGRSNVSPEHTAETSSKSSKNLPVRGVWQNGGGQRLVANSQKDPSK